MKKWMMIFVVAIAACGSSGPHEWDRGIEQVILGECYDQGGTMAECVCILNGLEEEFTQEEALTGSSEFDQRAVEIAAECMG